MILFNTTFSVDADKLHDFRIFLDTLYLPGAKGCGLTNPLLGRPRFDVQPNLVTGQPAHTYALQMIAPDQEALDRFRRDALPELYKIIAAWGPAVSLFETELDLEPLE